MKRKNKSFARRICVLAGTCLLTISVVLSVLWYWGIRSSEQKMESTVHTIRTLIPEPQSTVPEGRRDNAMPVLSMDGTDYVGILEIPRYGSALPVCADWGSVSKHPCRLSGSIYNRTMQIGGTSQKGQYDFFREISAGDSVCFTDMEGNYYTYEITDIRYEKHAGLTELHREEAALTLFIKNIYAFEYIVVFCNTLD